MGIDYLLSLQNIREMTGPVGIWFMIVISILAVSLFPLVEMIFLWCIDKHWGYLMIWSMAISELINQVLKLTFCVYRPWILDERVHPVLNMWVGAGGYSFPSGHTQTAVAIGGVWLIWLFQKGKKKLGLFIMLLVLLTPLSRNYLGVHTLQDVVVAVLDTALVVIVVYGLSKKIKNGQIPVGSSKFCVAGVALAIVLVGYLSTKSYPMDYDAAGKLLVDPQDMVRGGYEAIGGFLGILLGYYVEPKYIRFTVEGCSGRQKIKRAVIGIAVVSLLLGFGKVILPGLIGVAPGGLLGRFLPYFTALAVYPLWMKKGEANDKRQEIGN